MAYERAYFPMNNINVSQGYGVGTHEYSYALDLCGKDGSAEDIFAPFDCKITKLYQPKDTKKHATEVWITSTCKVLCPNGYYGYLTMSLTHPKEISNMKLGTKFKQGQLICHEGTTGSATGNHVHLELSVGTTAGWDSAMIKKHGVYVNVNRVKPEEYLFVKESAKIINKKAKKGNMGTLIKESDITKTVKGVPQEPLNIHKTPDYKSSSIIKGKGLKNNEQVIEFYTKGTMSYVYHYETLGYVASKYLV